MRKIELELEGSTVVFADCSDVRVSDVPEGKFKYSIRHTDDDDMTPATVERSVWVNFMMDIIMDKPIPKVEVEGFVKVKDWGFYDE